jgi:hypothetical protein
LVGFNQLIYMRNLALRYIRFFLIGSLILAFRIKGNSTPNFPVIPQYSTQLKIDTTALANKLSWYYEKAMKFKGNTSYRSRFFYLFPGSYKEFNSLYGFSDKAGEMALYPKYDEHINLFCESSTLNKQKFAAKIVAICINGQWDADAVNMLQQCALTFTNANSELIAKELNSYKSEEIKSFWYFLFDGPHPAKNIPVNIEKIRSSYPQVYRLAKEAFEQVQQQSEKHGE